MGAVCFGEFVFDTEARVLTRNGDPIHLTPKAFDLLAVLIEARPRALRKAELRERLWPDVIVDESNLKTLVAEIRAALADRGKTVRTVHRFGYAFAAEWRTDNPVCPARLIDAERIHQLRPGENLIGREADCAVVLDFTGISRYHAKITVGEGRFVLEDLGSKNGTWKNDERVRGAVDLQDGDVIRLGVAPLTFRSSARADSTATVGPR